MVLSAVMWSGEVLNGAVGKGGALYCLVCCYVVW